MLGPSMVDGDSPSEISFQIVSLDHPRARALEEKLKAEMSVRYGGSGPGPIPVEHFVAPEGAFVVAVRDEEAVACGGFRFLRTDIAEIKRMYVDPVARGQGVGRSLLRFLEEQAASSSYTQLWLETGTEQPEAIALYTSAGYRALRPYGEFKYDSRSRCFYRSLGA
jgi:GNAT superfamily N-acetyltransferase